MKLSKRLEAVATLVDVGKRVIDVGCDHGYLDIYLTLNNENKCIATDINEKALNSAINNIKKFNLEDKIETKLTDGLKDIKVNRNKYYCSEFVYEVLSSDGINILDSNDVRIQPEELINSESFNKIYEGKIKIRI